MARILRSASVKERSARVPSGDVPDVREEPEEILPPEATTEEPSENQRENVERTLEEARQKGYREGLERAEREVETKVGHLAELVNTLADNGQKAVFSIEDALVELTYEAVAQCMGEAMADKKAVVAVVQQVLARAGERKEALTLRVAPQDYEILKAHEALLAENVNAREIKLEPDMRVQMGGCLLETPRGNLDGRLEMQFQKLKETLLEARALSE